MSGRGLRRAVPHQGAAGSGTDPRVGLGTLRLDGAVMPIQIADYLPSDADAAARAALTANAYAMQGSMILGIAGQVRALLAEGREIANFTVGDFKPAQFRIPGELSEAIQRAVAEGQTNYPPSDGVPELREAIAELYRRDLGLDYGPEGVCVGSGARPPIYTTWSLFVEPGDRTTSFVPMWNVGYYAHLFRSDHRFIPTTAEANFFPTVEQCREAVRDSRLVVVNTPLNPTGTAASREVIEGLGRALVEENAGRERPCMLLFDQVYWMLTAPGTEHYNPVQLVPECAPYVVHVDAISKCFAGTGLRLGWGVLPPYLQRRMKSLVGHVGSWAPRAEQLATAWFLSDPARVSAYMTQMNADVQARLDRLNDGIQAMRSRGLPVNSIAPQGAIYLSLQVDAVGRKGFPDNAAILRLLLEEAGVAVVPFQAFDRKEDDGWFRLSVGAVGLDDIDGALERTEKALRAHL